MLQDPLFIIMAISILVVLGILIFGIGVFASGGEFNRKHGNRLMRYRIVAQAVAVVMIMIFILVRGGGG